MVEGFGGVHTYLDNRRTQILNNFEYISRTVNINSQNKRHFTYITQFTIHFFFLTHVPHVNYSNHGKKTMVHHESHQTFYKAIFDLSFL